MNLQEMLEEAITNGYTKVAYYIYWGIQQGISPGEKFEALEQLIPDWTEIERLQQEGMLNTNVLKVYTSADKQGHHLCLAYTEQDARNELSKFTRVGKITLIPNGMDKLLYFPVSGKRLDISEIAEQCIIFPYYVACYVKEDDACYRGDKETYLKRMAIRNEEDVLIDTLSNMYADGMITGPSAESAMENVRRGKIA